MDGVPGRCRARQAGAGESWKMSDHDDGKVGAVDLDGMTAQQLTALIAAAEAKRREKHEGAKAALRAEMSGGRPNSASPPASCSRRRRGRKRRGRRHFVFARKLG